MLSQFIQKLRTNRRLTQEDLAKQLGISRPTYIQIEQGQRDLTIEEARKLAEIFGVKFDNFLEEKEIPFARISTKKQDKEKEMPSIRINVPQKNLKKFKEVLLYILEKVGSKPNIGQSVINKLLYFIDFDYYEKYEEQLIGATYIKNHFGPTPCELIKVIDDMKTKKEIEEVKSQYFAREQTKYLPLRKPDLGILSARELAHIDEVLNRLSDKAAKEISEYSHGDIPWIVHEEGQKISYESVFYRDDNYSVRQCDDEL